MTQLSGRPAGPSDGPTRSNIYTVLVFIAVVALACGVGYVAYKNTKLTGTGNPFSVKAE